MTLRDASIYISKRALNKLAKEQEYDSGRSMLEGADESGWVFSFDAQGNVTDVDYAREKLGADTIDLFDRIGPCVKAGSLVLLEGEDGVAMRFSFDGERCHRKLVVRGDDDDDDDDDDEDVDEDDEPEEHPYWGEPVPG